MSSCPRCAFELEFSRTHILPFHIHLNYYPFVVLSLSFCLAFFYSLGPFLWGFGYVLSRVGAVTSSVIAGVCADYFNVIRLIQASHISIRLKMPCKVFVSTKQNAQTV